MILRTVIILCFYICVASAASNAAVPEATKPTPSSLVNDADIQKAIVLTKALNELTAILDDRQSISENIDEFINNSQTIGIIVKQGFNSTKDNPENRNCRIAASMFYLKLYENVVSTDRSIASNGPLFKLLEKHVDTISLIQLRDSFDNWKMDELKNICLENDWTEILEALQYSLVLFRDNKECPEDYSSKSLKKMYQNLMKKFFIFSTICETLINGPETSNMTEARRNNFLKIVGNINANLSTIITEKEKNWSLKTIKKQFSQNRYGTYGNSKMASEIYLFFTLYFNELNYEYLIGVSDLTSGFNKSVSYCKTECLHFGDFQNKNIYIFRNKINSNGYQKCDYLNKFYNKTETSNWCKTNKNVFGDLRDFANDIIKNCSISAVSLVNDKLNYQKDSRLGDFFTSETFDFPCFGVVNITIANYPL